MTSEPKILKETSCPSLSATSSITYQLGNTPGGIIHIRLTGNSGNGYFNEYWVSLPEIMKLLDEAEGAFIWSALCPLFEGRSVNSACFLMAVLMAEGLVQPSKEKPRRYEVADPKAFMAKVQAMIAPKPKKGVKKPLSEIAQPDPPAIGPSEIDPPADPVATPEEPATA